MSFSFDYWSFYFSFRERLQQAQQNRIETQDKINTWTNTQATHKKKKALLIGCNYRNTRYALYGCINDAKLMQNLLEEKFRFESVTLMTDDTEKKPYKAEILKEVEHFIESAQENDFLCIYFSGHGVQIYDNNGDESDGKDECYFSLDFQKVVDDELYAIVKKHDKKIKIMFMFDCCHSGTIMDFPYNINDSSSSADKKYEMKASCVCLSGCRDNQYSYESQLGGKRHGALTYNFDNIMRTNRGPFSYQYLLNKLQDKLNASSFHQHPQFSSSKLLHWSRDRFMFF